MPHHHAGSIDWQSLSPLASSRGQQVTVIALGLGRTSTRQAREPQLYLRFAASSARSSSRVTPSREAVCLASEVSATPWTKR